MPSFVENERKRRQKEKERKRLGVKSPRVRGCCSVPGCSEKHNAKGFCLEHYKALRYIKITETRRAYYRANREAFNVRKKEWRERNPEKVAANKEAYRERFKESMRKKEARRRSLLAAVHPAGVTAAIDAGMRDRPCARCGALGPSEIDHVLPISWADVQEVRDVLANAWAFQPLCRPCNTRKGNRCVECYVPTGEIGRDEVL
jgi:5-methylcytosine-specific restriction endonuclease McrA